MGNAYLGTKFNTEFECEKPLKSELFEEIRNWAAIFAEHQFAPALEGGFGGNLSIRDGSTFIITASGADLGNLKPQQVVRVCKIDLDENLVKASGCCLPSSESMLHGELYRAHPEINAIFHGHFPPFEDAAERFQIKVTAKETPYGSKELIEETLKISQNQKIVILKNHGFVSLGKTPSEAGDQVISFFKKLNL